MTPLQITLNLYIAGNSTRSKRAMHTMEQIQAGWTNTPLVVTIIDVLEQPTTAEQARVIATPTLVRVNPEPERRIIGDLSDITTVMQILNLEM